MVEGAAKGFTWRRNRPYILLTAIMFTYFAARGLSAPLFSLRAEGLGAALWQIGLLRTLSEVAAMLVQYLWGRYSDRVMRRKPLVLLGTAGVALSLAWIGISQRTETLFLAQALGGLSLAAYQVGSLALIGDLLERVGERGKWMGLYRGMGSLAFGLSALFGGSLADSYGLATPFLLAGGFTAVAFLLSFLLNEAPSASGLRQVAEPAALSWCSVARVLPFLLLAFVWLFSFNSAFTFWPVYMRDQGLSQTMITRLWGIAALGETVAMVVAGQLCDRFGSRRVLAGGLIGMGLVFVSYTLIPRMPWLIGIQLFRSVAYSSYSAAAMLYATSMGLRRQRAQMAGLYNTSSNLGGISGGIVGGALAESLGLATMIRAVAGLMIVVGIGGGLTIVEPDVEERT